MKSCDFGKNVQVKKKRKTKSSLEIHKVKIARKFWEVRQRSLSVKGYWLAGHVATFLVPHPRKT